MDKSQKKAILEKKLFELKKKQEKEEVKTKAKNLGINYIDLEKKSPNFDALKKIPYDDALRYKIVAFDEIESVLFIAVLDINSQIKEYLDKKKQEFLKKPKIFLTDKFSFEKFLTYYKKIPIVKEIKKEIEIKEKDLKKYWDEVFNISDLSENINKASISEIFLKLLSYALKFRVSDIHIEQAKEFSYIRFRIDGVLHNVAKLEKQKVKFLLSRIKLLSKLKINIEDKPQEGETVLNLFSREIYLRVSIIPSDYGEDVVIRILDPINILKPIEELGLSETLQNLLLKHIKRPNGLILTTGPTGSGKTTTLYSILQRINSKEKKIITLEDPIEYKLEGITQIQISEEKGLNFSKGLKMILRQDPDIILVGEIRDAETAKISINSALTGHLVLSSMHTNSSFATIPRFISLGAKPYLLSPALNIIIAQRLVRRLCDKCKKVKQISEKELAEFRNIIDKFPDKIKSSINLNEIKFYEAKGCDKCLGIGYKGRIGIFEILEIDKEIKKLILKENITEQEIKTYAISKGMLTMFQDAVLKVLKGITTLDEIKKVLSYE